MQIKIGAYCITHELSRTPLSSTYLAYVIDKPKLRVVLKVFHHALDHLEEHEKVFVQAERIRDLSNPYILPVIDAGIVNEQLYVVSAFFSSGSLRHLQEGLNGMRLTVLQALHVILQVGRALDYAHQSHILHKHLKPENILFGSNGQAYLADFSISDDQVVMSEENGLNFVTLFYMAPESFFGTYDERTDLYSLGCIAYELITGLPPFIEQSFSLMALAHHAVQPTPLLSVVPDLPVDVEQVIMKALEKDPARRHPDVSTFLREVSSCFYQQLKRSSLLTADVPVDETSNTTSDQSLQSGMHANIPHISPAQAGSEAALLSFSAEDKDEVILSEQAEEVSTGSETVLATEEEGKDAITLEQAEEVSTGSETVLATEEYKDRNVLLDQQELTSVAEIALLASSEPAQEQIHTSDNPYQKVENILSEVPLMLPVLDFVLTRAASSDASRFKDLEGSYQPDDLDMQEKLNDGALQLSRLSTATDTHTSPLFGRAGGSSTRPASQRKRLRKTTTLILFCLLVGMILVILSSYTVASGLAPKPSSIKSSSTIVVYGSASAVDRATPTATSIHRAGSTPKASGRSPQKSTGGDQNPLPVATAFTNPTTILAAPTSVATPVSVVPIPTPHPTTTGKGANPTVVVRTASYEAESALNDMQGGAMVAACSACSGGRGIYFYGFTAYSLQFNDIAVEPDGKYTVTLYYSYPYANSHALQVTVNNTIVSSNIQLSRTADQNPIATYTFTVNLQAGSNTILFSSSAGDYSPLFDRIVVSPV